MTRRTPDHAADELPDTPNIAEFKAALDRLALPYAGHFYRQSFAILPSHREWVEAAGALRKDRVNILNLAVLNAGARQLGAGYGLEARLLDGDPCPPRVSDFSGAADDEVITANFDPRPYALLQWMQENVPMTPETALCDGLTLLGAAATAGTGIVLVDLTHPEARVLMRTPNFSPDTPSWPSEA